MTKKGDDILLKFFGRGAGFSDEHNAAFFISGKDLVLIDCSITTFVKLKNMEIDGIWDAIKDDPDYADIRGEDWVPKRIVVLVTHTHSDHISGISMLIHLAHYKWGIPVLVITPSRTLQNDLRKVLNIEGCVEENGVYKVRVNYEVKFDWLIKSIPTVHADELRGRCFGYELFLWGKKIIYTGDTSTLDTFKNYITKGTYLYTECSAFRSPVHLFMTDLYDMKDWFKENDIHVTLMHLDIEDKIAEMAESAGYELAPLV